jgi:hypothetical protein
VVVAAGNRGPCLRPEAAEEAALMRCRCQAGVEEAQDSRPAVGEVVSDAADRAAGRH